jgi:WD40 repeat protein
LIYNTEERKLIHTSSNLIAPMEPETSIFAVAWDPTDNFIAVPVGKDIRIMNAKNGWAEAFKLSGHKGVCTKLISILIY